MQRKLLVCLSVLGWLSFVSAVHGEDSITVFLVRHAEKTADKSDPELSVAGKTRATALAAMLRSVKLDACFSSEFKRTQLTAAPTAVASKLKVTTWKAGKEKLLADELTTKYVGKKVLFVGHSNTVPLLMKHLGVAQLPMIAESEYDNLFILQVAQSGSVTVTRLHYGGKTGESAAP